MHVSDLTDVPKYAYKKLLNPIFFICTKLEAEPKLEALTSNEIKKEENPYVY